MASEAKAKPVGELKKIVSLVDRTDFDEFVYPQRSETTKFQAVPQTYHNYVQETASWPFEGGASWGQRVTFSVPWPWEADFLHSITLRLKPQSWLTASAIQHIGPAIGDYVLLDPANFWIWANSLGTIAIELAEMEVDGVIIESFTGDWINTWNKTHNSCTSGIAYDELAGLKPVSKDNILVSDDGYLYCTLPFWFSKFPNTAFPLVSCSGPHRVRFHITLRPFADVVRKLTNAKECKEIPSGQSFQVRDYSFTSARVFKTINNDPMVPAFEVADILCGISHMDEPLRTAYRTKPHEILMNPVVETTFSEPLKYVVTTSSSNTIKIGLPLTMANGPIKQLLFFLRRNANRGTNDWTNYGRVLTGEVDPTWNPQGPLLQRAQLLVGTAVWADEDERWWRASTVDIPGGIRAYGNYIYAYNFAESPTHFDPTGSVNASRVDMRLNLTVSPPGGSADGEWTVTVFFVGTNWIRFENGLANLVFMD